MGGLKSDSIPIVKGFLAPPINVPRLPMEHPYATLSMLTLPKLLCFGTIFIAIKIDAMIGRNNAVCLG